MDTSETFVGFSESESAEIRDTIENYLDPSWREYARLYFAGLDGSHIAIGFPEAWIDAKLTKEGMPALSKILSETNCKKYE